MERESIQDASNRPGATPPDDGGGSGKKRKLNTGRTSQACSE
jgi:hypothetical protein